MNPGICFQATKKENMKLSQFRFDFPLNLIAQTPTKRREDSRLMVVHKDTGLIENKLFTSKISGIFAVGLKLKSEG